MKAATASAPATWKAIKIPDDTHRKIKQQAAIAGMSMSDYLTQMIDQAAEKRTR